MRALCTAFVLAALLSGCASPDDASVSGDVPTDPAVQDAVQEVTWSMAYGVGTPAAAVRPSMPALGSSIAVFDLPRNTTRLAVASDWTCLSGPACLVNVTVWHGDALLGHVIGEASSALEVDVTSTIGEWRIIVYPAQPASATLQVAGTSRLTAFVA